MNVLEDAVDATAPALREGTRGMATDRELLLPPLPVLSRLRHRRERANRRRERDQPSFHGGPRVPQQKQHGQAEQPPARRERGRRERLPDFRPLQVAEGSTHASRARRSGHYWQPMLLHVYGRRASRRLHSSKRCAASHTKESHTMVSFVVSQRNRRIA